METLKRKFKCTGCGVDRPCFLETNQETNPLDAVDDLFTEDLKCVLDSTNQTSYNWEEVKAKTAVEECHSKISVIECLHEGDENLHEEEKANEI